MYGAQDKVSKTGDTMTGGLSLPALQLTTGPANGDILTSDASGNASWRTPGTVSGLDWFNVRAYGAVGDGVTDDTAALNSALAAANTAGGGTVYLPWGSYLVSATISIPPNVFLVGQTAVTLNLWTSPPSTLSRIIAAASWAPSSATGIVSILSKTPGGWAANTQSCGLRNILIDGSLNTSTNLNGLYLVGPVYDVHLDDVMVYKAGHNGIQAAGQTETGISATFPYHQRYRRVTVANSVNSGFNLTNFTDSTLDNCLAFGGGANGFVLQNNSNTELVACRSEWNTGSTAGRGFDITGASGTITLIGCTTDQNLSEGLRIHAATGQATQGGGIVVTGGKFHADGNGGTNNNGIKITGSTVPITITGVNVESGQNPNSLNYYPATALEVDTSSNVTVSGSTLQGITTAWSDGGSNSSLIREGCIGMTGNPGSQTTALLPDLTGGVVVGASKPLGDNGVGTLAMADASTVPTTNPTGGGVVYSESAATTPLKMRDVSGNVRSLVDGFFQLASSPTFTLAAQTATPVTLAVQASATYLMEACLIFSNSTGSTTPSWTGPTGATMQWNDTGASLDYSSTIGATNNSYASNAGTRAAFFKGLLVTSTTAGSLTLTLGVSAGTTTLAAGSYLRLTRVK